MKKVVIINWHDIKPHNEPEGTPVAFVHGRLTPNQFESQLTCLIERFKPITLFEYLSFLEGTGDIPDRSCIVTFDDGLKSCLLEAAPILEHFGIRASFFVCPVVYEKNVMLAAHTVNMLIGTLGLDRFAEMFYQTLEDLYGRDVPRRKPEAYGIKNPYPLDTDRRGHVKFDIHYALPIDVRDAVLASLFREVLGELETVSKALYLNTEEIRTLRERGHGVGSHGYSHYVMSMLDSDALYDEAERSLSSLRSIFPDPLVVFSYPQGVSGSYNDTTRACLDACGYRAGLVVDERTNEGVPKDLYTLSRYDMATVFKPDGSLISALQL